MTEQTSNEVVNFDDVALVSGEATSLKAVDLEQSEKYPIFSFGQDKKAGVINEGQKIRGRFLGTVPMFSKDFKENWDTLEVDGKTIYMSSHYAFEDANGKKFGIFASSTLWKLQKIPTAVSGKAFSNPLVEVTYVGKVEGRDVLKELYGIELTKGNSAHIFDVLCENTVDMTVKGCINYLRNPVPNFGAEKSSVSSIEQARQNWERQQRLINATPVDSHSLTM